MVVEAAVIADILACPACRSPLEPATGGGWHCRASACPTGGQPFPMVGGKSVLVDFSRSVLDRDAVLASGGASVVMRRRGWRERIFMAIDGENTITPHFSREFLAACEALAAKEGRRARILVVGGGKIGSGAGALYETDAVDLIGFDIYSSPNITMIADAHAIPLGEGTIDGVWIQAVLEHVVEPIGVVAEIERVLRPGGLVFADTPFLFPVHEKAYDFTRWTPSGHRWLFRNFAVIAAGTSSGPGTVSLLALRYLAASLFRSSKMGQILTFPLIWLRMLDRFCDSRKGLDAAGGLFFFGAKAATPISPKDLIAFYEEQVALQDPVRRLRR